MTFQDKSERIYIAIKLEIIDHSILVSHIHLDDS